MFLNLYLGPGFCMFQCIFVQLCLCFLCVLVCFRIFVFFDVFKSGFLCVSVFFCACLCAY